jgi:hypothetical protein
MVMVVGRVVALPVGSPLMVTWPGVSSVMSTPAGRAVRADPGVMDEKRRRRRESVGWGIVALFGTDGLLVRPDVRRCSQRC